MSRVVIKTIAEKMNLSVSTVNRALINKGRISEQTKQKVLKVAHEMGYRPNIQAKSLASKDILKIAVVCPDDIYFKDVIEGVKAYEKECEGYRLELLFLGTGAHTASEQLTVLRECITDDVNGIILSALHPTMLNDDIDNFAKTGIPTITVNNDVLRGRRIAYIGQNGSIAGAMAGELMVNYLPPGSKVAHMATSSVAMGLRERTASFREAIIANGKDIELCGPFEYHDDVLVERNGTDVAVDVLTTHKVQGIYANNMVGTCAIAQAIKKTGVKVVAIGHDSNDEINHHISNGNLSATLFQDPFQQGYQSLKLMFEHLYLKIEIRNPLAYIRTSVLMRANLNEGKNMAF